MSLPNELHPLQLGAGSASGYQIEQSLRFNSADSATLTRTPSSSGNLRTGTISFWIKRSKLQSQPVQNTQMSLLGCNGNAAGYGAFFLRYRYQYDYLEYGQGWAGGTGGFETLAHYRDVSAWQHVCLVNDFTNATAADKVRLYMNGVRQDLTITSALTNTDSAWNSANLHYIGYQAAYFDGYMAEFHNVDGTALDPDQFGEYDNNGVWRPIRYTGSHGTNGFYLKFDPSATNGIGHDHSGNGNNFSPSGFTADDTMSDTPTTNWCTLNPLDVTNGGFGLRPNALSNGNLVDSSTSNALAKGTLAVDSGKWYFEYTGWTSTSFRMGVALVPPTSSPFSNTDLKLLNYNGQYQSNAPTGTAGGTTYGGSISSTDIIGVAVDMDNRTIAWSKNGQYGDGSGNWGATYANASKISLESTGGVTPCCLNGSTTASAQTFNFGQRAFAYTPPTGFNALNTANLPAPDIADGSQYFDTLTYTGPIAAAAVAGTTGAVTGLASGFTPDFVWIKCRSHGQVHNLFDSVRGVNSDGSGQLLTNSPGAEYTTNYNGGFESFDDGGFTVKAGIDTGGRSNNTGSSDRTYVAWNWKAGGSGSTNTDGSITSTVSANPSAGFSIVSYTGTGANATVGHGLGVPPKMVIIKRRDVSSNWAVYHDGFGPTKVALLDDSIYAVSQGSTYWQSTAPSDTVVTLGTTSVVNYLNGTYVAYCFAEVESYSKFGSFEGNDADPGPFVYLGFKPALILLKNADASQDWVIYDTKRSTYNEAYQHLHPNTSGSENTTSNDNSLDILSNGFRPMGNTTTNDATNGPSQTIIYAAFAEHPFGGDGVSPATAR